MNSHKVPDLSHRLIVRAARKAPAALSARLEEEWLADRASRTGSASRLRLALGCCWATSIISRDFAVPQLAASAAATGPKPWFDDTRFDVPLLSRRTIAFILIAALHVLLIYVFAAGFAQHFSTAIPETTHGIVIEEPRPQPPPPQALDKFAPTVGYQSTLVVTDPPTIEFPPDPGVVIKTGPQSTDGPQTPPVVPPVTRVVGGPGKGFPTTQDYYPAGARRAAETGVSNVQVCVDAQGRLTADPTLVRSSGARRLDAAALSLAKAGSGHYRATTEDGTPVSSCFPYRIRFALTD